YPLPGGKPPAAPGAKRDLTGQRDERDQEHHPEPPCEKAPDQRGLRQRGFSFAAAREGLRRHAPMPCREPRLSRVPCSPGTHFDPHYTLNTKAGAPLRP